ncbi:MAG: M48 family metallopeptidase [Bacteroidales bacterium]|nr:M48 family metallopeptidase [Bacteroidales bacterium]
MQSEIILIIIISIVVIKYFVDIYLSKLEQKSLYFPIPDMLNDIYDSETIKKQRNYKLEHIRLSNLESFINFIVLIFVLYFGIFGKLDAFLRNQLKHSPISDYLVPITYFFIIGFAYKVLNIPFHYYSIFKIEKKYGFSNYTKKLFVTDLLKQIFVSIIIGLPLLIITLKVYFSLNQWFVPLMFLVFVFFIVFINYFYTTLILPLFNKLTPLPDEELKEKIKNYCEQSKFKIKDVYIIDESKRTTKANAFFSGFGKKKKIVLYDTLLKDFNHNEIIAILLHEIGHYKHKHIIKFILLSMLQIAFVLTILWLFLKFKIFSEALGSPYPSFHIGITAFGILYSPISFLESLLINQISRKYEYQADNFVKKFNHNQNLISSLKKLARKNYSHLTPHPLIVKLLYSHPPLKDRIINLL